MAILADHNIGGKNADWYKARVESFIQATNTTHSKDKTAEDLNTYLSKIAVCTHLEEWQYLQILEALRLLFQKMLCSS